MVSARWFDAHLDLAYAAECGRDMHVDPDHCRGKLQPAAVTLPSLRDGAVNAVLATIFTQAIPADAPPIDAETGAYTYPIGDADAAAMCGKRQLKLYQAWRDANIIQFIPRRPSSKTSAASPHSAPSPHSDGERPGEGSHLYPPPPPPSPRAGRAGEGFVSPPSDSPSPTLSATSAHRLSVSPSRLLTGLLMECADPIRDPDDLDWWVEQGVIAIGMAWWHQSRYAGGNGVQTGLTDLGRALVPRMDELGVVHDVSHLSDRSLAELFELTDAPVIASHSNCRALLAGTAPRAVSEVGGTALRVSGNNLQRHLTDDTIAEIARRGGVIGLNLVRNFIKPGLDPNDPTDRPSVDDAVAHIEHVCNIVGDRAHVGLGSDMDGGITANDLPAGINRPIDLNKLADALSARNWPDADIQAFTWTNWANFWRLEQPT